MNQLGVQSTTVRSARRGRELHVEEPVLPGSFLSRCLQKAAVPIPVSVRDHPHKYPEETLCVRSSRLPTSGGRDLRFEPTVQASSCVSMSFCCGRILSNNPHVTQPFESWGRKRGKGISVDV